jgi:aminopeptidase N
MSRMQLPTNVIPIDYDIAIAPNPAEMTFDGSVRIEIDVREPTRLITLNSFDLQFGAALLDEREASTAVTFDIDRQRANLDFGKEIAKGRHVVEIRYRGKIYRSAQGLFISKYDTSAGPRSMLLTQFEAVSARRFVPCWDEPALKATFSISVTVPEQETAVSNMPVESIASTGDGRRRVRFQRSPKMSSYLLFLCVGDFERIEANAGATKVAVLAKKGSAQNGAFALQSGVRLLEYFNDYFGVPYPLPKLDLIATPGAAGFSAMENWGAILFFEKSLLVDARLSTESDRQRVFVVVAHEMAHQWFGNLVTMEWWDDLWLNEGFAAWMENKATNHFHPRWMIWLQSEAARQLAMRQDSKVTTHPIVQPVTSAEVADEAFDDITYSKGQAVIRMLEGHVGEDKFRDGVRAYMRRYAYGNTVTDNLWSELEAASGKSIKQIADDFTLNAGVPLITVESATSLPDRVELSLKQGRFAVDDGPYEPVAWHIPLLAASVPSAQVPDSQLVTGADAVPFRVRGKLPVKVNVGQTAYARILYSADTFASLVSQFASLAAVDQLGLLCDAWALGEAGKAPIADYFELIAKVPINAEPAIWRQIIGTLFLVDTLYAGLEKRASFRAYSCKVLAPVLAAVGWVPAAGQADTIAVLREDLIKALGRFGDEAVMREARRRFDAFVAASADAQGLPAAIRAPTLGIVALWADDATYEVMHGLASRATDPLEKEQMFVALAWAQGPALAKKTLDIALGDEPAATTGPLMIARVSVDNSDLAWQFALDRLDALNDRLDALQRNNFVPALTSYSTNPARLPALRQFIDTNIPAESRGPVERYYADLSYRLTVRAQRVPKIDEWLVA